MIRCDNCQFFHPHPLADHPDRIIINADGVRGGGECRAVPPVARELDQSARFPLVTYETWRGWFVAKLPATSPKLATSASTAAEATFRPHGDYRMRHAATR